ncbi:MAG TPA: sigma-70 family RNA polymerase sigma factor [Thermoanaerobaculia bacterium]|nr:sigma-70 family RNA polymerase sigma factor [Thermoanaerobaculia bacterium]
MLDSAPRATDPDDELALLERVRAGDRTAFEALYRRFRRPLAAYLLRMTGSPEATDELIDDTLLVVWRQADRFDGRSRLSTWIFGIAYRKALKHLERRRREESRRGESDAEPVAAGEAPDRHQARRELARQVATALHRLPSGQRDVVVLTYYHGLSYPEIASLIDCPLGTVKTRMFHARRKLAQLLADCGSATGRGLDDDE